MDGGDRWVITRAVRRMAAAISIIDVRDTAVRILYSIPATVSIITYQGTPRCYRSSYYYILKYVMVSNYIRLRCCIHYLHRPITNPPRYHYYRCSRPFTPQSPSNARLFAIICEQHLCSCIYLGTFEKGWLAP